MGFWAVVGGFGGGFGWDFGWFWVGSGVVFRVRDTYAVACNFGWWVGFGGILGGFSYSVDFVGLVFDSILGCVISTPVILNGG